jgi:hypothetical protein
MSCYPNGIAVIEPGIDHFYAAPDIEIKSVALANLVAEALQGGDDNRGIAIRFETMLSEKAIKSLGVAKE